MSLVLNVAVAVMFGCANVAFLWLVYIFLFHDMEAATDDSIIHQRV